MHAWVFHSSGHGRSDGEWRWDCTICGGTVYRLPRKDPPPDKKIFVPGRPRKLWCEEIVVLQVLES